MLTFEKVLQIGQKNTNKMSTLFLIDYMTIASKLFKYKKMPKEIPLNIIEFNLFCNGRLLFFEDEILDLGYMCLPTGGYAQINNYGLPTSFQAIGLAGYTATKDTTNSVVIKNDNMYMPSFFYVDEMCKRLGDIWEAIGVNNNACKTPFVGVGSEKNMLSYKNLYKKVIGNDPLILVNQDTTSMLEPSNILQTGAVYYGDKFCSQMLDIEAKILTYLGINNNHIEKRERVNTEEVNSNNAIVNAHLYERLECRQEACKEINEMFGLNVSVEINWDFIKNELKDILPVENMLKEGEENG